MIVGIGELLWDLFPDGRKVAGGAPFNFAFHCRQLGHPAAIVSRVGEDALGRELRDDVRRLGLTDEWIQTDHEHPTGTVRVTVDAAGQPTYEIVDGVAWDHLANEGLPSDTRAICFGTLAQRSPVSRTAIQAIIGPGALAASVLRVFDVNLRGPIEPHPFQTALHDADWVKVNDDELSRLTPAIGRTAREWVSLPCHSREWHAPRWIVTRGAAGCEVYTSGEVHGEPGVAARVADTVGAGDAFTAAMVCRHLEGRPLWECARFATHYAARVCEHPGGTPRIDRREIESLLR